MRVRLVTSWWLSGWLSGWKCQASHLTIRSAGNKAVARRDGSVGRDGVLQAH